MMMNMKKQVIVIHGGDTFSSYGEYLDDLKNKTVDSLHYFKSKDWKDFLQEELGEGYEVIRPKMPNKQNAKYVEWKIWFEKILPLLNDEIILIGHSLGAIFLPKYLSENSISKKVLGTFLVSAPFDSQDADYELADFTLSSDLSGIEQQGGKIFLYHSKDDPAVRFADLAKYQRVLPGAEAKTFEVRGHFTQEEFPEIVRDIKSLFE